MQAGRGSAITMQGQGRPSKFPLWLPPNLPDPSSVKSSVPNPSAVNSAHPHGPHPLGILQLLKPCVLEPVFQNKRSHCNQKVDPTCCSQRKPTCSNEEPVHRNKGPVQSKCFFLKKKKKRTYLRHSARWPGTIFISSKMLNTSHGRDTSMTNDQGIHLKQLPARWSLGSKNCPTHLMGSAEH